ncbi:MAG: microtubule-binding protein [Bdellovibrio sp.]
MSFNYQKNKEHSQDSFWTSYSDLFLGLSTIFLLLYVTASLRTGTEGLRNQVENQKLSMKVNELQQQLKMYESVKDEYMQSQAPKDEVQEYEELMDKLTLLQSDAKNEKDRLIQEALSNDKKVKALNKYQQMVRNVLNANKMAKAKISNRNDLIKEQDVEIEQQDTKITELNKDIKNKEQLIAQGEEEIKNVKEDLQERTSELRNAYKSNKISKKNYEKKLAQLRDESHQQLQELEQTNNQYKEQIQQANSQLGQAQAELSQTKGTLVQKEQEAQHLAGALSRTKAESKEQMAAMAAGFASEKAGLEAKHASEKAGLEAKRAAEKAANDARLAAEKAAADARLAAEHEAAEKKVAGLRGALNETQGQLAKAKAEIEARKSVASEIQKGFAKAGIKADIDMQTGDVVLDFGQAYFDNDSSRLKNEMKGVIEKVMPIYSKSLFGNPKVSSKVSAVEVIGFASPTYQGRYVDPKSTKPEDRAALKYNMDLSYRRAKAIFNYMLDQDNVQFDHQKDFLSLMKVSGRSFLEVMDVKNRNVASASKFCKVNDCKKAQRVIIRFNMDSKK